MVCPENLANREERTSRTSKTSGSRMDISKDMVLELFITDIGKKGDGLAKKGGRIIFVNGARKGERVLARIENVHGNIAFARIEEKLASEDVTDKGENGMKKGGTEQGGRERSA